MPPPLEHRILTTSALCLLAFGAVMVYSASSPLGAVDGGGSGTAELVQFLFAGVIGLGVMRLLERRGTSLITPRRVKLLLGCSFVLLLAVLVPGIGVVVNGARRWFAAGPLQFQPSEIMKIALVLWAAQHLADPPVRPRGFKATIMPLAVVIGPACMLIYMEPDLGTGLVIAMTMASMMIAAGVPMRHLARVGAIAAGLVVLLVLASAYQRARLTAFLHPWASKSTAGFQAVQGQIAIGSGGAFGVGLGRSVQKVFYLPEAQTDFILAVVGEELGLVGIVGIALFYGMIAYAGLRTARRAATRYAKLLAAGLTSLILCQGILNIFVVLGMAPLTGVPLPFISYAPSNLLVMLASVGLLQSIARPRAQRLRALGDRDVGRATARGEGAADRDRSRRDGGARGAGAGGRRRAAGAGR